MTRKHCITLAQDIIRHNRCQDDKFTPNQLITLAEFCKDENSNFNQQIWLDYIAGKCGPSGDKLR